MTLTINPYFSPSLKSNRATAVLPSAPPNASPVPHLTSLYHFQEPGPYGDRSYPGNCGGNLIRDLLIYFRAKNVFDPMTGSGTCRDVCAELGIPCLSTDIRHGFDASDSASFGNLSGAPFDFIWIHPPYWRQKVYSSDPADLSRTNSLPDFLRAYERMLNNLAGVLSPSGHLAVLMGDYTDREAGFAPLTFHTKSLAFQAGLKQSCTDIIRFSHGNTSSRKRYRSSFIPGLHDTCMIFRHA